MEGVECQVGEFEAESPRDGGGSTQDPKMWPVWLQSDINGRPLFKHSATVSFVFIRVRRPRAAVVCMKLKRCGKRRKREMRVEGERQSPACD